MSDGLSDREKKLPKWARDELTWLRQRVRSVDAVVAAADLRAAEAVLATAPDGVDTVLYSPLGQRIGLGDQADVEFYPHPRTDKQFEEHFSLRLEGEPRHLRISGTRPVIVKPYASNVLHVAFEERR